MNLADVFTFLFVILGFIIVYVAYWLMAAGLFPQLVERCAARIGSGPLKTAFVGAITLVPSVAIGIAISSKAPNAVGKIVGIGVALLAMLAALFGSAGLALKVGRGLKSARDAQEPWRVVMRGGIVLALTFVMPFLGTFVLMPFTFIIGAGAFVLSCLPTREATPALESATPMPTAAQR
jgi:hypothetical protein